MKKLLIASLEVSFFSSTLLATNGTELIGFGAASRAMGGVGVATHFGAESALNNPALYSKQKEMEISGGLTFFVPNVSYTDNGGKVDSESELSILPELSFAQRINDDMAFGVGMMSVAVTDIDYSTKTQTEVAGIKNSLSVFQFAAPFSYKYADFSFGIAPVLQYSSLNMSTVMEQSNSSYDFGVNLGLAYEYSDYTFGLLYKTAIKSDYGFYTPLANPAIFGLGVDYQVTQSVSMALDYKYLMYNLASGFKELAWDAQHVLAFGAQYKSKTFAIRLGANYGTDVIPNESDAYSVRNEEQIQQSLSLFPAVIAYHVSFGGAYYFDKHNSIDVSGVFGSGSQTRAIKNKAFDANFGDFVTTNTLYKASKTEVSLTTQYNYHF